MNTDNYVKSCHNSPSDPNFYEELPTDPNLKYRTDLDQKIEDLLSSNIINEFEASKLQCGSRTPYFYGLPKIHKRLTNFLLYDQYVVDSTPVLQNSPNLLTRF